MVSVHKDTGLFKRAYDPLSPVLISQWVPPTLLPPSGFRRVCGCPPSCSVSRLCTREGLVAARCVGHNGAGCSVGAERVGGRPISHAWLKEFIVSNMNGNGRSYRRPKNGQCAGNNPPRGVCLAAIPLVGLRALGFLFLLFSRSGGGGVARLYANNASPNPPHTTSKNTSAAQGKSAIPQGMLAPPWLQTAGYPLDWGLVSTGLATSVVESPVKGETPSKEGRWKGGQELVGVTSAPTIQRIGASPSGPFELGTHPDGRRGRKYSRCESTGLNSFLAGTPWLAAAWFLGTLARAGHNVPDGRVIGLYSYPPVSQILRERVGSYGGCGLIAKSPPPPVILLGSPAGPSWANGAYSVGCSVCRATVPYATPRLARYLGYTTR